MAKKEKEIERLRSIPKNYEYREAVALLNYFSYKKKGDRKGSHEMYAKEDTEPILLCRPHPQKEMHQFAVRNLLKALQERGDISE